MAGGRSRSAELCRECVDTWKEGVVVVGQVRGERSSLSLVRALLRWNKPRLRNDIFSHPSNKLHIQQISGFLPKHFFPLQSLKKKLHVGLDYRDIIQRIIFMYLFIQDLRHHLLLCCSLERSKLLDNNFLRLMCWTTYEQSPFLIHWIVWFWFILEPESQRDF